MTNDYWPMTTSHQTTPHPARRQTPWRPILRYALAVAAVAAAMGLRMALTAWVGPGLPTYITFYPALMTVALLAGLGPGVLATALTGLTVTYWLLPPVGCFTVTSPVDRLGLTLFIGMGLFMSVVSELYRRHRYKAAAYDREAAVRESQARLATFAEATFEGIVESEAGRILDCNEQFARMLGYSVEEMRGMEIARMVAPEDLNRVKANIQLGRDSTIEHSALRKDGTRMVIEAHGRPVSSGSPRRHTAVRDITARKQAEQALRDSEERFRAAFDGGAIPMSLTAPDGRMLKVNAAFCQMMGYSEADLLSRAFYEFTHPDDLEVNRTGVHELLNGTRPLLRMQKRYVRKDGRVIWGDMSATVVRGSDGRPLHMVTHIQDITEHKLIEEELRGSRTAALNLMEDALDAHRDAEQANADLRKSQAQLALAATGTRIGMFDRDLVTGETLATAQHTRLIGLSAAAAAATAAATTTLSQRYQYDDWVKRVHPEDLTRVEAEMTRCMKREAPFESEYRVVWADGSVHWLAVRGIFQYDEQGQARRVIGIAMDVTDRRRQEEDLHRLNRTLLALGMSGQAMLRATDETTYLQDVCRIIVEDCGHPMVWIGYAEQDAAKSVRPMASAGFQEGYLETLRLTWADTERGRGPTGTCLRTGRVCECRNMLTDPAFLPWRDEAIRRGYASSIALPLMAEGTAFGALTIYFKEPDSCSRDEVRLLTDLSVDLAQGIGALRLRQERARAEKALRETADDLARSNKDLEQFAYVTSHDLKEPLRMVTSFTSLLKERYRGRLDATADEYLGFVSEGALRMQALIDDLLSYARVGRDTTTTAVDTALAVDIALRNLHTAIAESGARITRDALPTVQANLLELTQVFQNLIGNAVKFRKPGVTPEIHIAAKPPMTHDPMPNDAALAALDTFWLFSVRDNGIGIAPHYHDRLFSIFQRLHTREEYDGTGVGLAICKKIVEQYGGRIWIESEEGKGSTFCFTLPARGS